jgi:hypothetical protein
MQPGEWIDTDEGKHQEQHFQTRELFEEFVTGLQGEGWELIATTIKPDPAPEMKGDPVEYWLFRGIPDSPQV